MEARDTTLPFPPRELVERTGPRHEDESDEWLRGLYERTGRARRLAIERALPQDFSFDGKRVLDFGCGAGRVLRQFEREAGSGEFWGCDLYEPTISWLEENLTPPFRFYVSEGRPLPHPDEYFDLVYAISVFTHITDDWAAWMLDLHRILKPSGFLLATFIGPRLWERSLESSGGRGWAWDGDAQARTVLRRDERPARPPFTLVDRGPLGEGVRGREAVAARLRVAAQGGGDAGGGRCALLGGQPGHGVFVGRKRAGIVLARRPERHEPGDQREERARRFQAELRSASEPARSPLAPGPALLSVGQGQGAPLAVPATRAARSPRPPGALDG